jgi:hypothetical protein
MLLNNLYFHAQLYHLAIATSTLPSPLSKQQVVLVHVEGMHNGQTTIESLEYIILYLIPYLPDHERKGSQVPAATVNNRSCDQG